MRKNKYPTSSPAPFDENNAFRQCLQWVEEIYNTEDVDDDQEHVSWYLLKVLIDSLINAKNPHGRFIAAVKKLKADGSRFKIDFSNLDDQAKRMKAVDNLKTTEKETVKMIDASEKHAIEADQIEKEKSELLAKYAGKYPEIEERAWKSARERFSFMSSSIGMNGENLAQTKEGLIRRFAESIIYAEIKKKLSQDRQK